MDIYLPVEILSLLELRGVAVRLCIHIAGVLDLEVKQVKYFFRSIYYSAGDT